MVRPSRSTEPIAFDARAGHLEMLDSLVAAMLGDRADVAVTEADIRQAGIEILAEPTPADHPLYDA